MVFINRQGASQHPVSLDPIGHDWVPCLRGSGRANIQYFQPLVHTHVIMEGCVCSKKPSRNGCDIGDSPCSQPVKVRIPLSISKLQILTCTNQSPLYVRKICVVSLTGIALLFLSKTNKDTVSHTTN